MNIRTSGAGRYVAALVLAAAVSPALRADSPELGNAKTLYAQALYEDALVQLNGITEADVANQVDQYRALCLLALGRDREAQASLERIVVRAPLYVVKADDASPKLVTLFQQVRRGLARRRQRSVRESAGEFRREAFRGGPGAVRGNAGGAERSRRGRFSSSIADLKQLGEGFLKLTNAELTPAEPATPSPVAVRVAPVKAAFYTSGDADVVPPVEVVRDLPPWNPPPTLPNGTYRGKLQLDIDEQGLVERAILIEAIAPPYDNRLIAASKTWRFQPATKDGVAVKYRKTITVVLQPSGTH